MYPYSNKTVNLNGNQIDDPFDSLDKINWQKLSEVLQQHSMETTFRIYFMIMKNLHF